MLKKAILQANNNLNKDLIDKKIQCPGTHLSRYGVDLHKKANQN